LSVKTCVSKARIPRQALTNVRLPKLLGVCPASTLSSMPGGSMRYGFGCCCLCSGDRAAYVVGHAPATTSRHVRRFRMLRWLSWFRVALGRAGA
jgi:hypothetical protein